MELAYPSTPSHMHIPSMGLLPSALSTVTPPPTKKRPLQETTAHNIPIVTSPLPVFGKLPKLTAIDTFTPPDSRKKVRPETVPPLTSVTNRSDRTLDRKIRSKCGQRTLRMLSWKLSARSQFSVAERLLSTRN